MAHDCNHEQDFRDIFHKQNDIHTDTQLIKQAILGNGQPGLYQRVNKLEEEVTKSRESKIKLAGVASGVSAMISLAFAAFLKLI